MKIEEVKAKYKNEWVLLEVLKESKLGETLEAKVLVHSKDRDEVYDALETIEPGRKVETLYTGPLPKKHAVIFNVRV
jgi:hypothetical protein